jgi:pyruvate/2-oxoglutarate dehydrogenase complex dihydrolipoamide dehydrogenase (E3) component
LRVTRAEIGGVDRCDERSKQGSPRMTKRFDLVVIGTGTAASAAASRCRAAGCTVAVIDSRSFGGTCELRGCDPKKVLVGAAEAMDWTRRLEEHTGHVLGAHVLGPHAEEVINLFAMAMRSRMTAADIKHMIFAYPTSASDIAYMV